MLNQSTVQQVLLILNYFTSQSFAFERDLIKVTTYLIKVIAYLIKVIAYPIKVIAYPIKVIADTQRVH